MHGRAVSAIQRPDIIHRLQQFLGLRQWSVVPELLDGVRAVVIMGDVREVADEKVVERPCAGLITTLSDIPGFHVQVTFNNPLASGVVARLQEIEHVPFPLTLTLEPVAGGGVPGAFRDFDAVGAIPRVQLGSSLEAGFVGAGHYRLQPGRARNWRTGWTVYPGHRLLLESDDTTGLGAAESFAFMWSESTLRSS